MNLYPHRIRLRGPWECSARGDDALFQHRITMPCHRRDTPLRDRPGPLLLRRRFGYPGRIDAHERVWLTFAPGWPGSAVALNGTALGALTGAGEFDVTTLLGDRNELTVEQLIDTAMPAWGEVALEVRCSAHLSQMRATAQVKASTVAVVVSGVVAGSADAMLELYAVLDRTTVAYAQAAPGPFRLETVPQPVALWQTRSPESGPLPILRVDLIQGASVWHRWEQPLPLEQGEP